MRDVISDIDRWKNEDRKIAIATVIETWGSAPRGVGAKMAISPDGKIAGSVSGGCVEGAVYETGIEVLKTRGSELLHFGVADETAWKVGLACGGTIEVFVRPLNKNMYDLIHAQLTRANAIANVIVIRGPTELLGKELLLTDDGSIVGSISEDLDTPAVSAAQRALDERTSRRVTISPSDDVLVEIFVDVILPEFTLVIVGGVHIAIALADIAKTLGYRTIVIDPRRSFGSQERFPNVDQLIQAWPKEAFAKIKINSATAAAMLTHDPKIDDPALKVVLNSEAFYIGALGSQKTHAKRKKRLINEGFTIKQINRIHGPIGLPLGGKTPEEIALAIMAEIITIRHQISV